MKNDSLEIIEDIITITEDSLNASDDAKNMSTDIINSNNDFDDDADDSIYAAADTQVITHEPMALIEDALQMKMFVEAALLANDQPLSIDKIKDLFNDNERPTTEQLREVLVELATDCNNRGIELVEVASGFRFQVKRIYASRINRLFHEKPPRYSRAFLETLALIAYRQPITRAEIEDVRGVAVSSYIIKTLMERDWVRVVGHRDVPGRPGLYATTRQFLDYFNLKSLAELPTLVEIQNLDQLEEKLGEKLEVRDLAVNDLAVNDLAVNYQSDEINSDSEIIV